MKGFLNRLVLLITLICALPLYAQSQGKITRILFVLDASNSMYSTMDNSTRMKLAKQLLTKMCDSLNNLDHVEIALRVFGHQSVREKYNCKDTKLEVPFSKDNLPLIKSKISQVRPKGTTLIAYSLQQAAYDFPEDEKARNIIILITDGIEECDGDPCAVSQTLQKQGVILKPFIIGVGVNYKFRSQFECVGKYFEANSAKAFEDVLGIVVSQALDNTTAQVNLLDKFGRPTETDINMTFYRAGSLKFESNVVHTMNARGIPDTMYLDPSLNYDIVVHTIPPVEKKNVKLVPGRHNIIAIDAPQGSLEFKVDGRSGYIRLNALIREKNSDKVIHVQEFNTAEKYIVGTYDVEILCLPRMLQEDVRIDQSTTTTIEINQPGQLSVKATNGYIGDLYRWHGGAFEWIASVEFSTTNKPVVMQPGTYTVVIRSFTENNTANSISKEFIIRSGQVTYIKL